MSKQSHKFLVRRILVALDGSPHSQAALEAAANLAALLEAELMGVFVEDVNLLRLAQLPFAQEVRQFTATVEKLELRNLRRQLRLQAAQAQAELERMADLHSLTCSFRVAHGPVSAEVLAAALEADLLALGRASHARRTRLGSTAKTAVSQTARTVLLMRPGISLDGPILAIYDGSPGAKRALDVAAYLAKENGRLRILFWAPDEETAQRFQAHVAQKLPNKGLIVEYRYLHQPDITLLAYILRLAAPGLLVLNDTQTTLTAATIHSLVDELDYPVLLVR